MSLAWTNLEMHLPSAGAGEEDTRLTTRLTTRLRIMDVRSLFPVHLGPIKLVQTGGGRDLKPSLKTSPPLCCDGTCGM